MTRKKIVDLSKKLKVYDSIKSIKSMRNRFDPRNKALKVDGVLCLETFQTSLESIGVDTWLTFGTLLGAVREGDFLKNDLDMDFGVLHGSDPKKIEEVLTNNGFIKIRDFKLKGEIVEETYKFKDVSVDIFYFFTEGNKLVAFSFEPIYDESDSSVLSSREPEIIGWSGYKQASLDTGFEKIDFKGLKVLAPKNTHLNLVENYGEDYMVVKNGVWEVPNLETIDEIDIVMTKY